MDPVALALDVGARTLGDPRVTGLPCAAAIDAVLALLPVVAPVAHASLWRRMPDNGVRCVRFVGPGCPSRSVQETARCSLLGGPNGLRRGLLQVATIPGSDDAVVIARPRPGGRASSAALLRSAALALRPALDRLAELTREAPPAEILANASERRLARIGFDLHDGPIQTLAALIGDTKLMASQIAELLADDARRGIVSGRVGDLQARMVALEYELRCMCHSLEAPTVLCRPFERVIEHEVVGFERLTGVRPSVEMSGRLDELSPSQRIALLRIVEEALRNIRTHSNARSVAVRIRARRHVTEAVIEDDGPGFDVDAALARAVRDGRVGLIGMIERIRLLGGRCEVRSRAGGPSTVSVLLPAWR
jgi:signal transduction histidine kinase